MRWLVSQTREDDSPYLCYFNGTKEEMQDLMMKFINDDREEFSGEWIDGTESKEKLHGDAWEGIYGYNTFEDFCIDYMAKPVDQIPTYIPDLEKGIII